MPSRSSYTEGTPNWVDLQTTDLQAAKAFYAALFGWGFAEGPTPGWGGVAIAQLDGERVAAITAHGAELVERNVPPMWNTYIAVDDVDAPAAKVTPAGGRFLMEPFDVVDAGRVAGGAAPSGAPAGLRQARSRVGAA